MNNQGKYKEFKLSGNKLIIALLLAFTIGINLAVFFMCPMVVKCKTTGYVPNITNGIPDIILNNTLGN